MEKRSMPWEEASKNINDALDKLEEKRLEGLEKGNQFQLIKQAQLETELVRLSKKCGIKNGRIQKIQSKIAFNKNMFKALDLQIKLSRIKTEVFDPDSWRIQGFVSGSNDAPLPNLMVSIAVEKARSVKNQWFCSTDDLGFYSITVGKEIVAKLKETKLFLHLSDKNKVVIHIENKPLLPISGIIDIENISISDKEYRVPPNKGTASGKRTKI